MSINKIERGLTAPEVARVLSSSKFGKRVAALADYTATYSAEGGLAVYKKPEDGKITISKPDMPTEEEREKRLRSLIERAGSSSMFSGGHWADDETERLSYDVRKLLINGHRVRRDVAFFIHSHPGVREDYLAPSLQDLSMDEELRGNSPRVIEGILTPRLRETEPHRLLIYGVPSSGSYIQFYQTMEDSRDPSAAKMRELLGKNGYNLAIVEFNTEGVLQSDVREVAESIAS